MKMIENWHPGMHCDCEFFYVLYHQFQPHCAVNS